MLQANNIKKTFNKKIKALRGVSVEVGGQASVGLVGESGCGKSTLAKIICRLEDADAGSLLLDGVDYTGVNQRKMRGLRQRIQIIFQDNSGSLDPRRTVYQSLEEPLDNYKKLDGAAKREVIEGLLEQVALGREEAGKYPHQLSGGQRQRVVIARALALEPQYIICDEPVSSLDAEVQQPILELLSQLQRERGIGYLFISHDIGVTMEFCRKIYVMYAGLVVEELFSDDIARRAAHPYTRLLFSSALENHCDCEAVSLFSGNAKAGCPYHVQCPHRIAICETQIPDLAGDENHKIACFNPAGEGHFHA
ncbi:ATP-binding cassette domain-containing protein [Christensenellaceae bacterium OttesenSCG-928-K19]|nr:ATP-binding cassette domain-containing protein [Christensenellaceae bacterium OttesenSCG-928-K19]